MITSRDITTKKEEEVCHMTLDIISRFRDSYNKNNSVNQYKVEIPLPEEFIRSPRAKYISVVGFTICFTTYNSTKTKFYDTTSDTFNTASINLALDGTLADDISGMKAIVPPHVALCASFVQEANNDNQIVCFNNDTLTSPKRYEIHTTQRSITVWFADMFQRKILNLFSLSKIYSAIVIQYTLEY